MGGFIINQAVLLSGDFSKYITLNTLFGAVVALAVIVLIMVITYFVSVKPNLTDNTSSKTTVGSSDVFNQIVMHEEDELVNDCELVAVITAAIYASMGDAVPADGFVVRSIRKANSGKRWMNA